MKWFVAIIGLTLVLTVGMVSAPALAQDATVTGPNFVDEDGDGICDNFANRAALGARNGRLGAGSGNQAGATIRDADGDGIPNGQDPDYTGLRNGNRRGLRNGGVCPLGETSGDDKVQANSVRGQRAKAVK
jgi:hypothetical protein